MQRTRSAPSTTSEALNAKVRDEGKGPGFLSTRMGKVGLGLVILVGILEFIPVIFFELELPKDGPSKALAQFLSIALILSTTFLPALLMVLGDKLRKSGLKKAGKLWLILASLLWFTLGISASGTFPFNVLPLAMGGLILSGALLMSSTD